jgi:hypothetical protein
MLANSSITLAGFSSNLSLISRSTAITARLLSLSSAIVDRKCVFIRRNVEKLRSAEADATGSVNAT